MRPHFIAWFVSGVFVLLALPITFYEVAQHLENYRMPRLQRHVVRILLMVPIYAVDCWLALQFKDQTIYSPTIRECYGVRHLQLTRTASPTCSTAASGVWSTRCRGSRSRDTYFP